MKAHASLFRQLLWLALCAMLLSALAPTVSRILAASSLPEGGLICTTERPSSTGETSTPDAPHPLLADGHCAYCALQHLSPGVLVTATHGMPLPVLPALWVWAGDLNPLYTRAIRDAYHSRAPPVS